MRYMAGNPFKPCSHSFGLKDPHPEISVTFVCVRIWTMADVDFEALTRQMAIARQRRMEAEADEAILAAQMAAANRPRRFAFEPNVEDLVAAPPPDPLVVPEFVARNAVISVLSTNVTRFSFKRARFTAPVLPCSRGSCRCPCCGSPGRGSRSARCRQAPALSVEGVAMRHLQGHGWEHRQGVCTKRHPRAF